MAENSGARPLRGAAALTAARPHTVAAALVLSLALAAHLSFRFLTGGWHTSADAALLADCRWGRESQAAALLRAGANVNAAGSDGVSPLQHALWHGLSDGFARQLLAACADVHHVDSFGFTPLVYAGARGHDALALTLVARGARINQRNSARMTALDYCEESRTPAVARALRAAGALTGVEVTAAASAAAAAASVASQQHL